MVPDSIRRRWEGSHWRWWAFAAGVALVGLALLLASIVSLVRDGEWEPLVLLGLMAELLALGIAGSGMLDGLAGRPIAGGMARQPLPDERGNRPLAPSADQEHRDRKTIRSGLAALPVFVTFVVLLFG